MGSSGTRPVPEASFPRSRSGAATSRRGRAARTDLLDRPVRDRRGDLARSQLELGHAAAGEAEQHPDIRAVRRDRGSLRLRRIARIVSSGFSTAHRRARSNPRDESVMARSLRRGLRRSAASIRRIPVPAQVAHRQSDGHLPGKHGAAPTPSRNGRRPEPSTGARSSAAHQVVGSSVGLCPRHDGATELVSDHVAARILVGRFIGRPARHPRMPRGEVLRASPARARKRRRRLQKAHEVRDRPSRLIGRIARQLFRRAFFSGAGPWARATSAGFDDIGIWTLRVATGARVLFGGREELKFAIRGADTLRKLDRDGQTIASSLTTT